MITTTDERQTFLAISPHGDYYIVPNHLITKWLRWMMTSEVSEEENKAYLELFSEYRIGYDTVEEEAA